MTTATMLRVWEGDETPRTDVRERAESRSVRRVLIVGAGELGLAMAHKIASEANESRRVVGFVEDDPSKIAKTGKFPVLGGTDAVLDVAAEYGVDEIILAYAPSPQEQVLRKLVASGLDTRMRLKVVPSLAEAAAGILPSETIADIPLVELACLQPGPLTRAIKRCFDVLVAALLLLLCFPLFLLVALAIKLDSKGPVLFRQTRVGKNGRLFTIYKFRTMVDNAEAATGPVLATEDDPRVTPVGRFLRSTRLDELPQLFNVLLGDMSLVGPRPERPEFVARFMNTVYGYNKRLEVRPGITGLAHVYGGYATSPFEKLKYDWMYVSRCSLALDLAILARTIGVVLRRRGR